MEQDRVQPRRTHILDLTEEWLTGVKGSPDLLSLSRLKGIDGKCHHIVKCRKVIAFVARSVSQKSAVFLRCGIGVLSSGYHLTKSHDRTRVVRAKSG